MATIEIFSKDEKLLNQWQGLTHDSNAKICHANRILPQTNLSTERGKQKLHSMIDSLDGKTINGSTYHINRATFRNGNIARLDYTVRFC